MSEPQDPSQTANSPAKVITINLNWFPNGVCICLAVVVIVCGLAILLLTRCQLESKYIDALILAAEFSILIVAMLLYMIQCGTEVAKKALDLQIELEKRKSEEEKRAEEDKKCEAAEKEQREHELKLVQFASTIKVEVSNV